MNKFAMLQGITSMSLRSLLALIGLCVFTLTPLSQVSAEINHEVMVTPVIVSEKAKARDILKENITITNTTDRKLTLYPSVNDVDPLEGDEEFTRAQDIAGRQASLANWIELTRGVIELGPGEEKLIPFIVRVNLSAVPGTYHAHISFADGTTREAAEKAEPLAEVTVTIEVQPDIKEALQLDKFFTDNIFLSGDDVLFNYQIQNIGNQDLKPTGEIRIYDRKGEEIASVPVNAESKIFSPEQSAQLAAVWAGAEGFGKYKAFLSLDYGSSQRASVQDTVFFWIVPWKQLLGLFVISILLIIFLVFYYHQRLERRYAPAPVMPRSPVSSSPIVHASRSSKKRFTIPGLGVKKPKWKLAASWSEASAVPAQSPSPIHTMPNAMTSSTASVGTPFQMSPLPTHKATPIAVTQAPEPQVQGETINLRELCKKPEEPAQPHEVHVINLKQ